MAVQFKVSEFETFSLVEIDIDGGVIDPSELATLNPPQITGKKGVVLSGRAPIWLMAALAHHFHITKWVATFDPRLAGGVVVSRHAVDAPELGEVVPVPKPE